LEAAATARRSTGRAAVTARRKGARGNGATGEEEKEEGAPAESSRAAAAEVVLDAMEMRRAGEEKQCVCGEKTCILRAGPGSDHAKKKNSYFEKKKSCL